MGPILMEEGEVGFEVLPPLPPPPQSTVTSRAKMHEVTLIAAVYFRRVEPMAWNDIDGT